MFKEKLTRFKIIEKIKIEDVYVRDARIK